MRFGTPLYVELDEPEAAAAVVDATVEVGVAEVDCAEAGSARAATKSKRLGRRFMVV